MHPISKKLNVGLFNQNLFASGVGITQIQPIVAYQLGSGWALSAGDLQFTYDWERDEWVSLPLGFQIGAVRPVAGQALRFAVNPQYDFKDITGADRFKVVSDLSGVARDVGVAVNTVKACPVVLEATYQVFGGRRGARVLALIACRS